MGRDSDQLVLLPPDVSGFPAFGSPDGDTTWAAPALASASARMIHVNSNVVTMHTPIAMPKIFRVTGIPRPPLASDVTIPDVGVWKVSTR